MIEDENKIFKNLIKKDPEPGKKNRVMRDYHLYKIPGWVYNKNVDFVEIKYKTLKRSLNKVGLNAQCLYDIIELGLTNIEHRPKCNICGNFCKFKCFSGYSTTCGNFNCIKKQISKSVSKLWENSNYKSTQINSHLEYFKKNEDAIEAIRQRNIEMWKNDEYRNKLIESHKQYILNNPDKMLSSFHGKTFSNKMNKNINFDSSWEKDFIKFCDNQEFIKSIERATFSIPYEFENKKHNYFPDFILTLTNDKKLVIEIKSKWLINFKQINLAKFDAGKNFVIKNKNTYADYLLLIDSDLYKPPTFKDKFNTENVKKILENYLN